MADDSDEEMLSWDESVFPNEHVFEIGYVPESVLHHESQMDGLRYALNPAVRGSRLLNVILDVTLFGRLAELAEYIDGNRIDETVDRCPSTVE